MRRALVLFVLLAGAGWSETPGNRFVFTQLRHAGRWDPYPDLWPDAAALLRQTTRLVPWPERRVLSLNDDRLFESPLVVASGRGEWTPAAADLARLRDYLAAGGTLFIDDSEAAGDSAFARTARALPDLLFPGSRWRPVPSDHAVYRSFFLMRSATGRRRVDPDLRGLWLGDRLVMVWSANDLLGALARDSLGQPLHPCEPGGEVQRAESQKLFVNIVMFALTGTYKTDAVHQPFLERKGAP